MAKNLVLFNGKWASIKEHCQDLGISYITAKVRKRKTGEPYEQVLAYYANPDRLDKRGLAIEFNGKIASVAEHCRDIGIKPKTVYEKKINTNWDYPKVLQYFQNKLETEKLNLVELDGELLTRQEYCKKLNYNYNSIHNYERKYNLSWEDAINRYLDYENKKPYINKHLKSRWHSMIDRCYNPKNPAYHNYGGRGITVQESWHDYFNFAKDMLESFLKHYGKYGLKNTQLDRFPNINGNYEITNVRWATILQQANNKSSNIWVKDGKTFADFCRENNLDYDKSRNRLEHGWSLDEILNSSIRIRPNVKYKLPCNALMKHCKQFNYDYTSIIKSIKQYNLTPDKALAKYLEKHKK